MKAHGRTFLQRVRWVVVTLLVMAAGESVVFLGYCWHGHRESRAADRAAVASKLRNVERLLSAFAETSDAWCLERAASLADEACAGDSGIAAQERSERRREHLDVLFRTFALIEDARDPLWDPRCGYGDRAQTSDPVEAPDRDGQLVKNHGADGSLQTQHELSVAENHCIGAVDSLIRDQYQPTAEDRAELTEAIHRILPGHERARRFLTLVPR